MKIVDNFANRQRFVVAGDNDGDIRTVHVGPSLRLNWSKVYLSFTLLLRYGLVFQICCGGLSSTWEGYTFHCYVLRDKEMVRG